MGSISCKACDCNHSDVKLEGEFNNDNYLTYQGFRETMNTFFQTDSQDHDQYKAHIKSLIKIQAFARRIISRTHYLSQQRNLKPVYFYFNSEEVKQFVGHSTRMVGYRELVCMKTYKNGGVYSGEMKGNLRDGLGSMKWKDGACYDGFWSFGRPFGIGTFVYPDGEIYKGQWKNYYARGKDSEISGLGIVLWKENVKDGYKWLWFKKTIDLNSPRSVSLTPRNEEKLQETQEKYLEMKSDFETKSSQPLKPIKEQKIVYPDGSTYIGDVVAGVRQGIGKLSWPDGDTYTGEWKNDIQTGWGVNDWSEGSSYTGFFIANLKEGVGLYKWPDGAEYFGQWKTNKMHGIGKYTWTDGKIYLGEWEESQMQGFGVLLWKDGRKYEGTWMDGKKHGEGVTWYSNGRLSRDIWRYGRIIKPDV
ncbi:hypothetical protein SteCoe_20580 [Stentor coeruleus]|uniref:MORN repeat protein n=1 Tax=Stentor coeruleus TaxID=5963 RepID=A0A1R2BS70_9CILI|nr:hypothetical protein SteCoe_20580 [Stentor coeruleus]